jgi:hypothetical protein
MFTVPRDNAHSGHVAAAACRRGAVVTGAVRPFATMFRITWQAPSTLGKDHGQRPEEAPYG